MERFFEKITRALVENGNIREEEEEVYQYALKSMLILGGNILLSLMIGVCMGMPGYCVLFLCMLVPLRSDAGGYHAPNLFICYLLSFASPALPIPSRMPSTAPASALYSLLTMRNTRAGMSRT